MYHFLADTLQPHFLLQICLVLAFLNLLLRVRKQAKLRWPLIGLVIPLVLLFVLSLPAVAFLAVGTLEWHYPPLQTRPDDVQAIVVPAAGMRVTDTHQSTMEPDPDSLYRCLKAAELYHRGKPCPILVSGGKASSGWAGPSHAQVLREQLLRLGVRPEDVIVEDQSTSTYENARESRRILEAHGIHKIVLVTDGVDLWRAELCYRKQGFTVVPAGCHYRAIFWEWSVDNFLPEPGAVRNLQRAWHEWLGLLWYWLTGKI